MATIFASDFHGTGDAFINKVQTMMNRYPSAEIVLGGDYIDGRADVKQVLNYVRQLQHSKHHVTVLKGNHEDLLLEFLRNDDESRINYNNWKMNGGNKTFKALTGRRVGHCYAQKKLRNYQLYDGTFLYHWLMSLPTTYVNQDGAFVHAYLDVEHYSDIQQAIEHTTDEKRLWERKAVDMLMHNKTDRALVVGHTPTCYFAKNCLHHNEPVIKPYESLIIRWQDEMCPIIEYHYPNESSIIACDGGCHGGAPNNTGNVLVIDQGKVIDWLN